MFPQPAYHCLLNSGRSLSRDSVQECAEDFVSVVSAELVEVLVIGELAFGEERGPVFDVFDCLFVSGGGDCFDSRV